MLQSLRTSFPQDASSLRPVLPGVTSTACRPATSTSLLLLARGLC